MKFRKKPFVVDADQYDGVREIEGVVHSPVLEPCKENPTGVYGQFERRTRSNVYTCIIGDWVVRHPDGSFEVIKPDVFEATYEAVPSSALPWIETRGKAP